MSVGPTELLILALVMLPLLAGVAGVGALVFFLTKKRSHRTCVTCGLSNVVARQPCPRCGVLVG